MFHALNSWIVKITKKKNFNVVDDFLFANDLRALVVNLFLGDDWFLFHLDIDERNNPFGQFVLWSFNNDDKFLILIWTNLNRDFLLKFFA